MKSYFRYLGMVLILAPGLCSTDVQAQYDYSGNNYSNYNRPEYNYSGHTPSQNPSSSGNYADKFNSAGDPTIPMPAPDIIPSASGDPTDPDCDPLDPACPIDSGLLFFLVAGAGYGVWRIKAARRTGGLSNS